MMNTAPVTITLDTNDPRAKKVMELAETFATMQKYPSGLIVHQKQHADAAERFLVLICEILGLDAKKVLTKLKPAPSSPLLTKDFIADFLHDEMKISQMELGDSMPLIMPFIAAATQMGKTSNRSKHGHSDNRTS